MNTLTAEKRDLKTKAKKLRKEGYVIGNLFGRDIENSIPLKVDSREAAKFLKDNKKGAHITLLVDGENVDAIVKEIDYNAMKNETMFINFQALVADEKIHTTAAIELLNEDAVQNGIVEQSLTCFFISSNIFTTLILAPPCFGPFKEPKEAAIAE